MDIVDFWRGRQSWAKFDSFVEQFDLRTKSYLSWAKNNDVDRFREARAAGLLITRKPRKPETFEVGQAEQLLAALYLFLQQLIHTTAQKGAKHPKRFRGKPWPSVATAIDALEEEDRERLAQANRNFLSMFEVVPEAEFEAELAEHRDALEAGAVQTPPQLRAEAAAWGQAVPALPAGPGLAAVFSDQSGTAAADAPVDPPPALDSPLSAAEPLPAGGGWADWPSQPAGP